MSNSIKGEYGVNPSHPYNSDSSSSFFELIGIMEKHINNLDKRVTELEKQIEVVKNV